MEAGERMRFLPQYDYTNTEEDDRRLACELYTEMVELVWDRFADAVEVHEMGAIKIYELPLRLDFNDGSYLHILVSGFQKEPAGLTIAVEEHAEDGSRLSRHRYQYGVQAIIRHEINDAYDETLSTTHASLINLLKRIKSALSEGEDALGTMSNAEQNAQLEADMMLNDQPVSSDEMFHLGGILASKYMRANPMEW